MEREREREKERWIDRYIRSAAEAMRRSDNAGCERVATTRGRHNVRCVFYVVLVPLFI